MASYTDGGANNETNISYYSAWCTADWGGTSVDYTTAEAGGTGMVLIGFIGLLAVLAFLSYSSWRTGSIPFKLITSMAWVIPIVWIVKSPPSPLTAGSTLQTAVLLVLIGVMLILAFNSFSKNMSIRTTSQGIHSNEFSGPAGGLFDRIRRWNSGESDNEGGIGSRRGEQSLDAYRATLRQAYRRKTK